MAGFRPERVAQLLQEAITEMLQRGHIKDPRVGQATVAEVKVTKDLRIAKVYVQAIGGAKEREDTVKGLQNAEGFIRRELRPMLSLKSVPELLFRADDTAEKADRVLGLLAQLNQQKAPLPPPPVEEPADDDIVESDELEEELEEKAAEEPEAEELEAEEPSYIHESDFEEPETDPKPAKKSVKAKAAAKPKAKAKAAAKPKAKAAKPKAKAKPAKKTAKKTAAKKPAKKLTKK